MQPASVNENTPPLAARWFWLALVMSVFVSVFLGRFAWPPLQSEAMTDLNLTNAQAGLFMNAFYLGYVGTQLPGGMLTDRFGAKLVLTCSLLMAGCSTLMLYFIESAQAGYLWRIAAGLSSGAVYSSSLKATISIFPKRELGRAFGILMVAPTLGSLIPNQLAPRLSLILGGWRPSFMALGLALILLGLIFSFIFPSGKSSAASAGGDSPWTGLKFVLREGRLRLLCLVGFCLIWCFVGFVSWGNQYLMRELNFSELSAGQIMTAFGLFGLVATVAAGAACDRILSAEFALGLAYLFLSAGLICFPLVEDPFYLFLAAGLVGAGVGASSSIIAVITANYAGARWAATAGGATGTVFQSAGFVVPSVLGLTVDLRGDYSLVWPFLIIPAVLSTILIFRLARLKTSPPN